MKEMILSYRNHADNGLQTFFQSSTVLPSNVVVMSFWKPALPQARESFFNLAQCPIVKRFLRNDRILLLAEQTPQRERALG
jgi:hypothetical protein